MSAQEPTAACRQASALSCRPGSGPRSAQTLARIPETDAYTSRVIAATVSHECWASTNALMSRRRAARFLNRSLEKYRSMAAARSRGSSGLQTNPVCPSIDVLAKRSDVGRDDRKTEAVAEEQHAALKDVAVRKNQEVGGLEEQLGLAIRDVRGCSTARVRCERAAPAAAATCCQ